MKRFWVKTTAAVGLSACGLAIFSACAHDDSSMFIHGVVAPAVAGASNGQGCTYTADPTALALSSGVLDAAFTRSYTTVLLVGNQLTPRTSQEQGRTETDRIDVQGAIVTPTLADGTQLHAAYTRSAAGTVDPSQGSTPGYAAIGVEVVDHTIIDPLVAGLSANGSATRVLVHVKIFGQTLGGQHVESNDFEFPIDVCVGCLVAFPSDAISATNPGYCTPGTGSAGTAFAPCIFGQDQPIDCRTCQTNPVCRPAPAGVADAGGGG